MALSSKLVIAVIVTGAVVQSANRHREALMQEVEWGQTQTPAVVRTFPSGTSTQIPRCAPIVMFLNTPLDGEFDFNLLLTDANNQTWDISKDTHVAILEGFNGNAIVVLMPEKPFPPGVHVSGNIKQFANSDQPLIEAGINFDVMADVPSSISPDGIVNIKADQLHGSGDVGRIGETGGNTGIQLLAFSTGNVVGGVAIDHTSSLIAIGPIDPPPLTSLAWLDFGSSTLQMEFEYKFVSEEFDEFVGKRFDDTFIITMSGPSGGRAEVITSVNRVGIEPSSPVDFAGLDSDTQQTQWTPYSFTANVGKQACIGLFLSDVGDSRVETVVTFRSMQIN